MGGSDNFSTRQDSVYDTSCMTKCMKDNKGFSDTCAACFGELASCTASSCWVATLLEGERSPKQVARCVDKHCIADFKMCSGIDDLPKSALSTLIHAVARRRWP